MSDFISNFNNFNGPVIKDLGDIICKMFVLLAALVIAKVTKDSETLFANHFTPWVIIASLVLFLIWIFSILVPNHITTIATLVPISFMYGIACFVSFASLTFTSLKIAAIFNLALWVIIFLLILFINYQNQNLDVASSLNHEAASGGEVAASGGEIELVPQKFDSNVLDQGQLRTQQEVDSLYRRVDSDIDSMVDLEENRNRVVMLLDTDAR